MRKLKLILFLIIINILPVADMIQGNSRYIISYVKTDTGRSVILYSDHTWEYNEIQQRQSDPIKQSLPKNDKK